MMGSEGKETNDYKCIKCTKYVFDNQNSICCDHCDGWLHLKCSGLKLKELSKIDAKTKFVCKYGEYYPCGKCDKPVYPAQNGVECSHDDCRLWYHLKCTRFTLVEYTNKKSRLHTEPWYCPSCTRFPFGNVNSDELRKIVTDETRLTDYFNILTCNTKFNHNCSVCLKKIKNKHIRKSFPCTSCKTYVHRKCTNLSTAEMLHTTPSELKHWKCQTCLIDQFPF